MKPRLEPCDHTEEDAYAWAGVVLNARPDRFGTILWTRSLMQDRRDADLMLTLTRAKDGLRSLKATAQTLYDGLTAREQDVMRHLWGTRRP